MGIGCCCNVEDGDVGSRSYDSVAGVKNFFRKRSAAAQTSYTPQQQYIMSDPKDIEMGDDAATNPSVEKDAPDEDEDESGKGLIRVVCSNYQATTSPLSSFFGEVY